MGSHTAIIAQSGSGKSFFLGRLIEELMLQTRSRCVVFDPNADFRKVYEPKLAKLWEKAAYDPPNRCDGLPHEASREEFATRWSKVQIRIKTGVGKQDANFQPLQLWWPSLSMEILAEDVDPLLRTDLYHLHSFVQALEPLIRVKNLTLQKKLVLIDEAERLIRKGRGLTEENFRVALKEEFDVGELNIDELKQAKADPLFHWLFVGLVGVAAKLFWKWRVRAAIERAVKAPKYVSEVVERFYFGKASEYKEAGILQTAAPEEGLTDSSSNRLEVIDLPSLRDRSTRLLAVSAVIKAEWDLARELWSEALEKPPEKDDRVPVFIVVDEAHNLIPAVPRGKAEAALLEQFRTVVSEGRKYGLFLVLVTQRPDKLDPLILSECENKVVMRLGSMSVLNTTRNSLGLEDIPPRVLEKVLEFEVGRALLIGRWSPEGPHLLYGAARRTVEGGRDLRAKHWATAPDSGAETLKKPSK
jgi:hypothetical protein